MDVHANVDLMADEVRRVCGAREAHGYRRFIQFLHKVYRYEMNDFIDRNIDSPLQLLTPNLARLILAGGFRTLAGKVGSYLEDPRTQKAFSFQAMYAGVSPFQALALYAVISYMDSVEGVYFPLGGIHALPEALAGVAEKSGAELRYATEVTKVEMTGERVTAVITSTGERIPADVVILNPDLAVAQRDLLGREPRRLRYSPSCFLLHAGSSATYSHAAHHNIHFGDAWRSTFRELISEGTLMRDPSFLVTSPTKSDPTLAPDGRHTYYVLFPTPNLMSAKSGPNSGLSTEIRWSARWRRAIIPDSARASRWNT
jgi:phytoene desaturase